jgi:hypothetical protein
MFSYSGTTDRGDQHIAGGDSTHLICTDTEPWRRNGRKPERHRCDSPVMLESAEADFRNGTKAVCTTQLNTIDCSSIGFIGLPSWFLRVTSWQNETLISGGNSDGQEGAGLEPGSVFRCTPLDPYEFILAQLESPTINKLAELCEVMGGHPLTLVTLEYAVSDQTKIDRLLVQVRQELDAIVERRIDD